MKCSPNKRNYMWIPVDSDFIEFWVISKIKNENVSFMSQFISFKFLNVSQKPKIPKIENRLIFETEEPAKSLFEGWLIEVNLLLDWILTSFADFFSFLKFFNFFDKLAEKHLRDHLRLHWAEHPQKQDVRPDCSNLVYIHPPTRPDPDHPGCDLLRKIRERSSQVSPKKQLKSSKKFSKIKKIKKIRILEILKFLN